ncbi:CHASE domain-containing protein [Fontisphaera persica]|uniref:CHASE domain-containing protein n=1 Tax=Fontisphaera persica TaxID=2974023 RepID=UPI0024C086B3|nr:CHASE domain-containing protein [Fontisphaera persica]WCJ61019.1 CHASE domain-containing protein [Fontisphaera persica]
MPVMRPETAKLRSFKPWILFGIAFLALLFLSLVLGGLLVQRTDRYFRLNIQEAAEMAAQTLPLDDIRSLMGGAKDLDNPVYARLKAQFQMFQKAQPGCRFVYLLGRRPDGQLFIFLDGEPPDSPDYSPPGQAYTEAAPGYHEVFKRWTPQVIGPVTDRWGTWVTALIPVNAGRMDGVPVVLGVDYDARAWQWNIMREAVMPVLFFTLLTAGFFLGSALLFNHRRTMGVRAPTWLDYLEAGIVLGCGLLLTGLSAWLAHQAEYRNRHQVLQHWSAMRMVTLAKALDNVVHLELEGLGRFFEGSESVTWQEFQQYANYLTHNRAVQAWGWMPAISPWRKLPFEQAMRGEGLADFEIWEKDSLGNRVPAAGRDVFYPVTFLAPLEGNQAALGFDGGSHPGRRRALEAAARSGLTTATEPLQLVHEKAGQMGMIFYRPVFSDSPSGQLSGYAFAALRLEDFLRQVITDRLVPLEWSVLGTTNAAPLITISSMKGEKEPGCLAYGGVVLAGGQVFQVLACGGKAFEALYPKRAGLFTGLAGLFLSSALGVLVGFVRRYEARLEFEVAERTEELRASEETFRKLFEDSSDAILLTKDGRFVDCNKAAIRLFRAHDKSQIVGKTPVDFSPERQPDGRLSAEAAQQFLERGEEEGCRFEWETRCLDGESLTVEVTLVKIELKGERHLYNTVRDITARKKAEAERDRLQAQLLQAQKMESVGRLAGGVAHDFNNMLHVILNYTEMSKEDLPPHHPVQSHLKEIYDAARRSAELTRKLLGFSRQQTIMPKLLNLNEALESTQKMLQRSLGEEIRLEWIPGANLWPVKIDPLQLDQILTNLCVNARDAIVGTGKVTIETRNVTVDEATASQMEDCLPGDYVMLAVSDTGCGMTPEVLQRIFEPFFTTKPVGQGTGLGLAMVYGVMQQNHGFIQVESHVGKGSCFRLYFPRHEEAPVAAPMAPAIQTKKRLEMGHETVLLVEDEAAVWRVVKTKLERLGYRVLVAHGPEDALKLGRQARTGIDLLLTDVVMPGMNGHELYQQMLQYHPRLKCLYMSGYTANIIAERGVVEDGIYFLPKPFNLYTLSVKMREVLAAPPVAPSPPSPGKM